MEAIYSARGQTYFSLHSLKIITIVATVSYFLMFLTFFKKHSKLSFKIKYEGYQNLEFGAL